MRVRLYLNGYKDVQDFCRKLNYLDDESRMELVHSNGRYRVNAKSFLGVLLAHSEWGDDIWFESDKDLYSVIEPWINIEGGDGNYIHE